MGSKSERVGFRSSTQFPINYISIILIDIVTRPASKAQAVTARFRPFGGLVLGRTLEAAEVRLNEVRKIKIKLPQEVRSFVPSLLMPKLLGKVAPNRLIINIKYICSH